MASFWAEGWTRAYRKYVFEHDRNYDPKKGSKLARRMAIAWKREER